MEVAVIVDCAVKVACVVGPAVELAEDETARGSATATKSQHQRIAIGLQEYCYNVYNRVVLIREWSNSSLFRYANAPRFTSTSSEYASLTAAEGGPRV